MGPGRIRERYELKNMLEITHKKNSHGYDVFDIITANGSFEISYENNLDLYWRYLYHDTIDKVPDTITFKITKENYFLYSLLLELYKAIKEKKPYQTYPKETFPDNDKKLKYYGRYELYRNGEITWYSDDFAELANASSFKIKRMKDYFQVTFIKSKTEDFNGCYFPTYSVRLRNSGSRFYPFNITFMGMYEKLKTYNYDYHQIHLEEYLYKTKKRVLSK